MTEEKRPEEESLKRFYARNVLRNVYGLKDDLSSILAEFINSFYEKFFESFDYEKAKRIRNAQSHLIGIPVLNRLDKLTFYIGLMDKDTLTYKFSIDEAMNQVFKILDECTISVCKGSFKNKNNELIIMDSLKVVQFKKNITNEYIHFKAKELKEIFNQESILTEINYDTRLELNNETEEYEKEVQEIMNEYNMGWDEAVHAYNSGLF